MMSRYSAFRLVALVLLLAVTLTFVAPARADAIEPLTMVAIAGAAVVVIVLIAYLIVANARGGREATIDVACAEGPSCWPSSAAVVDRGMTPVRVESP